MKRKIAVILCLVLCSMTFFGCSSAELGYLNLAKDMVKMTEYEISGNIEVFYDAEKLKKFVVDNIESTEYTEEEIVAQLEPFTGSKKINLKYDGSVKMNKDDMSMYLNLDSTIDGQSMPLGTVYASATEGVYVQKQLLLNFYKASNLLLTGSKDSYLYSKEYAKDFEAALGTEEYIEIASAETMKSMFEVEGMGNVFTSAMDQQTGIYDAAVKFISDAFSGYTTNVVKQTAGGYEVSADGEMVVKILSDALDYCAKNMNTVVDSLETYMTTVTTIMMASYPADMQKEMQASLDTFKWDKEDRAEFAKLAATLKVSLDYWIASADLDLKALTYKESVKKEGNSYVGNSEIKLATGGSDLAYIKSQSKITDKKVNIVVPKTGTPMETVMEGITAVENKYNPITSVKITWEKYQGKEAVEADYCDIFYSTKYDSPLHGAEQYDWSTYYTINKEMYVSLRDVCDILKEDLQWDNKTKTAYVMKDGKKIVMNSVLKDGDSYAKVRNFEKLGYTVAYDGSVAGLHTVTISVK